MSNIICLKGVLVTPFILSTAEGNYDVEKETFYHLNETYYFQLYQGVYPWRILKAIKVR